MDRPILMVCDDVALVAMVRGLLEREGLESVLATSVADAVIAYGHYAPGVLILDPTVEGGRGRFVLEELAKHPASPHAAVLFLGGAVEGCPGSVVPLPLDGAVLLQLLANSESPGPAAPSTGVEVSGAGPSWWYPVPASDDPTSTGLVSPEPVALPAPSHGKVTLEQLAQLVMQLSNSRISACLEVTSSEATRTLWLKDGRLIAASSSLYEESLLSRARADGLLDREQEKELRALPAGSASELIRAMRTGGYLREVEVVPLVQRNAEQIALEALSEEECAYRLSSQGVESSAIAAPSPAPVTQLLPRALGRTMSEESILSSFGGLDAVPIPRLAASALGNLGLGEAELALLAAIDGVSSVGELLLGCAMPQEQALKLLRLARLLRAIEIRPGSRGPGAPGPDVDIRRLQSKFEEIREADYFTVLGLSRSAGGEEVRQAFEVLSAEFNPLKFAGHLDPSLLAQAAQIQDLLAEAAHTLQNDRLRTAYAGNLVD